MKMRVLLMCLLAAAAAHSHVDQVDDPDECAMDGEGPYASSGACGPSGSDDNVPDASSGPDGSAPDGPDGQSLTHAEKAALVAEQLRLIAEFHRVTPVGAPGATDNQMPTQEELQAKVEEVEAKMEELQSAIDKREAEKIAAACRCPVCVTQKSTAHMLYRFLDTHFGTIMLFALIMWLIC